MLEVENKRVITITAGVQGTGKSTFGLRMIANAAPSYDLIFIFDPEGEYEQRLRLPAARTPYELSLAFVDGLVIYDPEQMFGGNWEDAFAFFCRFAFDASERIPGRKLFVVDEAWRYVSPRKEPMELANCVRSGRKRGLELLFNTQTPNLLYGPIRNECTELVCFRLGDVSVLDYVKTKGLNPEEISTLPDLYFVAVNVDTRTELRGKIEI